MKNVIESKRIYNVHASINGIIEDFRIDLKEIISNDDNSEIIFSMQELIDDILDLKINKSMYFKPNRDDEESKGLISRIN